MQKQRKTRGQGSARHDRKTGTEAVAASAHAGEGEPGKPERIAKRMARAGLCSRREAEAWIAAGRVHLNGNLLHTPAVTVGPKDRIEVDGKPLAARERTRLWLFHKPAGLVTTNRDPEGRKTVFDILPESLPRVLSVGRLDINTEGLLLLTNDGGLSRVLELPSTGWLRRYRVRAHGRVTQEALDRLGEGVAVNGVLYGPIEAVIEREQGSNVWITMAFREGKNREVKEVLGSLGLEVNRLIRISYGPFQLGDLPAGSVREIRGRTLRDQLGERLVRESGADFDAPLITAAADVPRSASKAAASGKRKPAAPAKRKPAPGQADEDALARMTTRSDGKGAAGKRKSGPAASQAGRGGQRATAKRAGEGRRDAPHRR